jgi:Beta-propeller repeat
MNNPRFLDWTRRSSRAASGSPRTKRPRRLEAESLESRSLLTLVFGNTVGFGSNSNGPNSVTATGFAMDSVGNRIITGAFFGTVDIGGTTLTSNGSNDGFIAKFTPTGALEYAKSVGGTLNDDASAVAVDSNGNAYVTGFITGANVDFGNGHVVSSGAGNSAFVWKLDSNGTTVLAVATGTPTTANVQPQSIALSSDGTQVAIGGFFTQQATFGATTLTSGPGNFDGFSAKLDTNGNFLWASQLKATAGSSALVSSVAFDLTNKVDAVGQYVGTVDFDPGAGTHNGPVTNGATDPFFMKFDAVDGSLAGISTATGVGNSGATSLVTDNGGNMYAVGAYQATLTFTINGAPASLTAPANTTGFYFVKLNTAAQGTVLKSLNVFDSTPFTTAFGVPSIAFNTTNSTLVVGATYNQTVATSYGITLPSAGQTDVFVATYGINGNQLLATSAGGVGTDSLSGVAVSTNGVIGLMGNIGATAKFGGTTLPPAAPGGANIFVSQISQGPAITGDFLGQGYTQAALYQLSNADWQIRSIQGAVTDLGPFGWAGHDLPAAGDYAGAGFTVPAVYRPSTAQWFVKTATGTDVLTTFGWAGHDIPAPADYDGLGRTEQAVYRPSTAQWFVNTPGGSSLVATFGWINHDIPVPADYLGLGFAQIAVYRPSTAQWFIQNPNGSTTVISFGWANHDIPVPGDYAQTGHATQAVYRPNTSQFFVNGVANPFTFGTSTPIGTTPLVNFPALAHTGTLSGLPNFNSNGIVTNSLPASVRPSITIAQAVPRPTASAAQALLKQPLTSLFAKDLD